MYEIHAAWLPLRILRTGCAALAITAALAGPPAAQTEHGQNAFDERIAQFNEALAARVPGQTLQDVFRDKGIDPAGSETVLADLGLGMEALAALQARYGPAPNVTVKLVPPLDATEAARQRSDLVGYYGASRDVSELPVALVSADGNAEVRLWQFGTPNTFGGITIADIADIEAQYGIQTQIKFVPIEFDLGDVCNTASSSCQAGLIDTALSDAPTGWLSVPDSACDPAAVGFDNNCFLSSVVLGRVPRGAFVKAHGSAVLIGREARFGLTATHVISALRDLPTNTSYHVAQSLEKGITSGQTETIQARQEIERIKSVAISVDAGNSSGSLDLSAFELAQPFTIAEFPDEALRSDPLLNAENFGAFGPGTQIVGVGFGHDSAVGAETAPGTQRMGVQKVVGCPSDGDPSVQAKLCHEGRLFLAEAVALPAVTIDLNGNRPCKIDSGSPAYVQMEDGTIAVAGILREHKDSTGVCGDKSYFINLVHPDVQEAMRDWLQMDVAAFATEFLTPSGVAPSPEIDFDPWKAISNRLVSLE